MSKQHQQEEVKGKIRQKNKKGPHFKQLTPILSSQ